MASNINYNKAAGRYAFVSAKEKPWHGLGTILPDRMTSAECIKAACLDYEVEKGATFVGFKSPIIIDGKEAKGKRIDRTFCTYRVDTGQPFSIVGNTYEVIQNWEAFDFFDGIVGENRAIYETAGALGNGETVFLTAKLPEHILIGGKDTIEQYLLFTMSHDGSGSIIAKFTPIRVVCANTLAAALQSKGNIFRIKHSRQTRDKLEDAQKLLAITYKTGEATRQLYESLTKIKITDSSREMFFLDVFLTKDELTKVGTAPKAWKNSPDISTRKKNQLIKLFNYAEVGPGQDLDICKGTAYGAFNVITGYLQNVKSYTSQEKKFESIMTGSDADLINSSLNLLTTKYS